MYKKYTKNFYWLYGHIPKILRIMKIIIIILFMSLMQVSAATFGQNVTLKKNTISLEQAFREIKKQTGYNFFLSLEGVKVSTVVNADFNNEPLGQVMNKLLAGLPLSYTIDQKTVIIKEKQKTIIDKVVAYFANIDVFGKILDEKGEPISGAIVRIKGTGRSTRTDEKGAFELKNVPEDAVLELVSLSYQTKEVKALRDLGDIRLETSVISLEDVKVVSTGYEKVKPQEINGTISLIDEKALNATQGTNILDRIIGQSSGLLLNIGKSISNATTNITIRGLGTIDGPKDPLIVLDGYIYEGDINNINPNEIENVSILKDASAASIWGARAGNGVIVISSKKGKLNQKMQLGFSAGVQVRGLADLMSIPLMSPSDYVDFEQKIFNAGYFDDQITRFPFRSLTPAVEILLALREGKITAAQSELALDKLRTGDVRKSYQDNFYTNPISQQYALNVRGGGEVYTYLMSVGYDRSILETYGKDDKLNLLLSNQFKPVKNLTISTNLRLTSANSTGGRYAYNSLTLGQRSPSYLNFSDGSGVPISIARAYRTAYTDTAGAGKLRDWKFYPTEEYKHNIVDIGRNELIGSVGVNYRIFDYLNAEVSYQLQRQNTDQDFLSDEQSYYARDLINSFTQLNRSSGVVKYIVPPGGVMRYDNAKTNSSTGRFQLNLDKPFGGHIVRAIAGMEARDVQNLSSGQLFYGYKADPLSFSNVDFVNFYPDFITGNTIQIQSSSSLQHTTYRFVSFYGNASYSYLGKYLASASVRRDGSNIFGANTNDKWKPLWSAGLGWVASSEHFYNIGWLPLLRFNATFGYTGNVDLTKTSLPVAVYSTNNVSGFPFTRVGNINNPDLRWEQLSQLDLKASFQTRENKLSGTVSYFIKRGTDLYGSAPYDYTGWGNRAELVRNVADMKGYGIDAELHSNNIKSKTFTWGSDLYFNFNRDKTLKYYRPAGTGIYSFVGSAKAINPLEGMPLYGVSSYKWGGLNSSGDPIGYLDGKPSTDYDAILREGSTTGNNIIFNGVASPAVYGYLVNTFSYKRFSASLNLSYRFGYYFQRPSLSYSSLVSQGTSHSDYALRWQKPGDENITSVPSFVYPVNPSRDNFYSLAEINVLRADNIRLQYVNLAYRFASDKTGFPIKKLELTAGIQNGWILWRANKEGIDPDNPVSFNNTKTYAFTLKGNF